MAAANQFLREQCLPVYNQRFAVAASEVGTAFVPWSGTNPAEILGIQEERVVAKDNTVRYQGLSLQIPPDRHRFHYVKAPVRVHAYPDGTVAVFMAHGVWRATGRMDSSSRPWLSPGTRRTRLSGHAIVRSSPLGPWWAKDSRQAAEPMVARGTGQIVYFIHRTTY